MKERQDLNHVITKYEKEKIEEMNNYRKLQSDYKIAVATLELTDHAFN